MRDCTVQSTAALLCPEASCDGTSGSSGTSTTTASEEGSTTPKTNDADGTAEDDGEDSSSTVPSNEGDTGTGDEGSTEGTGTSTLNGSPTTDGDLVGGNDETNDLPFATEDSVGNIFCEPETKAMEQCVTDKCSQCEEQLSGNDASITSTFDCAFIETSACDGLSEANNCCPGCSAEFDELFSCTLPVLQTVCPELSCDGGGGGGEGGSSSASKMTPGVVTFAFLVGAAFRVI